MENKKKALIAALIVVFAVIIAVGINAYNKSKDNTSKGDKNITVEVVMADESSESFEINTDEEFLRGALEQEELIEGTESEYGLFVSTVAGYTANDENEEWWAFSKDGESLMTGVDDTPISDGDHFEITLTVGF